MKKFIKIAAVVFLVALLAACGSGGGGDDNTSSQSLGGIWRGAVTETDTGTSYQSIGFITETGELRFLTEDGDQVTGNVSANGNQFSGSITSYAPLGYVYVANGLPVISGSVSGTIQERSTFSGNASFMGTVASTFSFTYDPIYERDSSLAAVAGVYSETDSTTGITETYSIDVLGTITGSTSTGCLITGNISLLNSSYNVYRINVAVTFCGELNGNYTGLASLLDESGNLNDTLAISVSGSTYVISGSIPRI